MGKNARVYVLDANVFIQAKNQYYSFAVCPGFWEALPWLHGKGSLTSIDRVGRELLAGNDDLAVWVKDTAPGSFFASSTGSEISRSFGEIMSRVQASPRLALPAKAEFARGADGWLVAFARVNGLVVVTHEEYSADARRRVLIPNICRGFGVEYVNTFRMLEDLQTRFIWTPPE